MQKKFSLLTYVQSKPEFQAMAADIIKVLKDDVSDDRAESLFPCVKACSKLLRTYGDLILNKIDIAEHAKIRTRLLAALAQLCAIIDGIAESAEPEVLVVNFVQKDFIDLVNNLRSMVIVWHESVRPEYAEELLRISLMIIVPFFQHNLVIVHPEVKSQKQKLNDTKFFFTRIEIQNIAKYMYSSLAKIACNSGNVMAAKQILATAYKAHEASKLPILKVNAPKYLTDPYCESLRQQFKTCTEWRSSKLQNYSPFKDKKNFMVEYFILTGKCMLAEGNHNLDMIESYYDMGAAMFGQLTGAKGIIWLPTPVADEYYQLSVEFSAKNEINRELRCLLKAKNYYEQTLSIMRRYPKSEISLSNFDEIVAICNSKLAEIKLNFKTIEDKAFLKLSTAWQKKAQDYADLCLLHFDTDLVNVTMKCTSMLNLRALAHQLKLAKIKCACDDKALNITIHHPASLTVKSLRRFCMRARADIRSRQAANAPTPAQTSVNETVDQRELSLPASTLLFQHNNRIKAGKVKKKKMPALTPTVPAAAVQAEKKPRLPDIDWGQDFPSFSLDEGDVYPFPHPDIETTALTKGVFFAYIDSDQLADLDPVLLQRFQEQLALGTISNEEKAQGIRYISASEANNTDYTFKINIGGEDMRLFGRPVAIVIVDETPRTLICFDQAMQHGKKLKLANLK